nr:class I SAM-dependent methyltransferase [uncultured Anaeromusa sp.]
MIDELRVTTARKAGTLLVGEAKKFAEQWQGQYVTRGELSLEMLRQQEGVEKMVIFSVGGPVIEGIGWRYFYHPSMAALRALQWERNGQDALIQALALQPGETVLDGTLGLGADAVLMSLAVGATGKILGVENSPWVAMITSYGLEHIVGQSPALEAAMRRIETRCGDVLDVLRDMPNGSVDAVYLDPMFRYSVQGSSNMQPLHQIADRRPLNRELLQEACRVARRRVVIKEAAHSPEWERLGIHHFSGGHYSRVRYGILKGAGI